MAFKVSKSKKDLPENRFEFDVSSDPEKEELLSIPLLAFLPVEAAHAFERGLEIEGILIACDSDAARAYVGSLDTDQFREFMREWNRLSEENQKVSAGESSASSGS